MRLLGAPAYKVAVAVPQGWGGWEAGVEGRRAVRQAVALGLGSGACRTYRWRRGRALQGVSAPGATCGQIDIPKCWSYFLQIVHVHRRG